MVVSDEVHMDFARPGASHTPYLTLGGGAQTRCIACTSASKTFNLAGLQIANTVIPDEGLRAAFREEVARCGYGQPNAMGLVATQAAYEQGEPWFSDLKRYLEGNWELLSDAIARRTPELVLVKAESTYLAWVDCSALGLHGRELARFFE